MAVGTIVSGVLGTLVNQRVPYVLAAAVLLVMIVAQSIAWWSGVRTLRQIRLAISVDPLAMDWRC